MSIPPIIIVELHKIQCPVLTTFFLVKQSIHTRNHKTIVMCYNQHSEGNLTSERGELH